MFRRGPVTVPRFAIWAFAAVSAVVAALVGMTLASGGGRSAAADYTSGAAAPHLARAARFTDAAGTRGGDLPVVYVDPSQEKRWTYVYHIQGESYREPEFLGLCRTIARDNPAMVVNIVPNTAMSRDEIELVRARIREQGLSTIHVLTTSGAQRMK